MKIRDSLYAVPQRQLGAETMSLQIIPLRKLLLLFYAPANLRTEKLRDDIRTQLSKEDGDESEGGDFYTPFWADAKGHMFGTLNLPAATKGRIAANVRRTRLYEASARGFLSWWNDKRRWRNEPIQPITIPARARLPIPEVGGLVKIENVFGLNSGPDFHRLIYPYFSEKPSINVEAARLGLWAMSQALGHQHDLADMRILDVQRGASFGTMDQALNGDEREIFTKRYAFVISEWDRLRREY